LQLQKKKSVHQQDEEYARRLQEQERQEALQRAKSKQQTPPQPQRRNSGPLVTGVPVGHGTPVMAQPVMGYQPQSQQPMNVSVTVQSQPVTGVGLPPGVKIVKLPKGVALPPGCVLGSDDCVYDQSNGYRAVGKLKKNEKKKK